MYYHDFIATKELKALIHAGKIRFAGNKKLKIFGTLSCRSGKRMKKGNRVFFSSKKEATSAGYRPCRRCIISSF